MADLRQSTSQIIRFGPFLDDTDGKTPETGLTIAQADMQLSKDGAAFAQKNASGNATHDKDGWYSTTLNTTDTATTTILEFQVTVAGALPYFKTYNILTASAYDAIYTGTFNNLGGVAQTVDNNVLAAGATGFAAIDTVVDAILVDTADMQPKVAKIPLSDGVITWNSTALASINAEADTALTDYDGPTNAEMIARTRLDADYFSWATDDVAVVTLVNTLTTYTNNTPQTADHTSAIADIPTVSEFNARTLVAASYFDSTADNVIVGTIGTGVITATSIAASALDGKGNWNIGKTGYSLTQNFPTNFADMTIEVTTGIVSVNTVEINGTLVIGAGVGGNLWRA